MVPSVLPLVSPAAGSEFEDEPRPLHDGEGHLASVTALHDADPAVGDPVERAHDDALPPDALRRRPNGLAQLDLRLVPREASKVSLAPQHALDPGGADLELVGVLDEVRHVERGAEVARHVRAELEVHGGVASGQVLPRRPRALDADAKHPAAALRPEFDVDHLGTVRAHDRIHDAIERDAIDSVKFRGYGGGHFYAALADGQKKTRAPVGVPRARQPPNWAPKPSACRTGGQEQSVALPLHEALDQALDGETRGDGWSGQWDVLSQNPGNGFFFRSPAGGAGAAGPVDGGGGAPSFSRMMNCTRRFWAR